MAVPVFLLGWKMLGLEQSLGSRIVTYAERSVRNDASGIFWFLIIFERGAWVTDQRLGRRRFFGVVGVAGGRRGSSAEPGLGEHEAAQLRPEVTIDAVRQRRHHRAAIRPQTAVGQAPC